MRSHAKNRKIVAPIIAVLTCVSIAGIGYASWYVIGDAILTKDSNVDVIGADIEDISSVEIGDITVTGSVVFGPSANDTAGNIVDTEADSETATQQESLSFTASFNLTTTSDFSGSLYLMLAPSSDIADSYTTFVSNGYILDPVAGSSYANIGSRLDIVSVSSGVASAAITSYTPSSSSTAGISNVSVTETETSYVYSISFTATFGWGSYFDYLNPSKAEEEDTPTNTIENILNAISEIGTAFPTSSDSKAQFTTTLAASVTSLYAKYDFTTYTTTGNLAADTVEDGSVTTDSAHEYFNTCYTGTTDPLVYISPIDGIYRGNSTGYGDLPSQGGFLRMGNTSGGGSFTLSYPEGAGITRAVISAQSWSTSNNASALSVTANGTATTAQATSLTGSPTSLTFDFDAVDSLTIQSSAGTATNVERRCFVFSIAFYH